VSHKPSVVFQGLRAIFEPLRQVALRFGRRSEPQIKLEHSIFKFRHSEPRQYRGENRGSDGRTEFIPSLRMSRPAPPIIHLSRNDAGEPAPTPRRSAISHARLKIPPMCFRSALLSSCHSERRRP
jgi:hypothetical protein